jgi:16S rRNA C967 or C1407 C5-methylase (RsmB/RsmF family)
MIPALLLDARPAERTLDLCAAPGNKMALMAQACDGSGYVLMSYHNAVLGVGFYDQKQDVVASLFPKSMAAL